MEAPLPAKSTSYTSHASHHGWYNYTATPSGLAFQAG